MICNLNSLKSFLFVLFSSICGLSALYGQSPPSDLTELSLEQILGIRIIKQSHGDDVDDAPSQNRKWSAGYRRIHIKFSGQRDGTRNVSSNEVLWNGNAAERTDDNFPILTQEIDQEAHIIELATAVTERLSLNVLIPYIVQATKHKSIVSDFERFTIRSEGLGDVSAFFSYMFRETGTHYLKLNGGISLPTGAINEADDTPAPGSSNQLPYTMQLGSGTVDLSPGVTYWRKGGLVDIGAQLLGTIRLGRNYRGYSLGDRLSVSAWLQTELREWLHPSIKIAAQFWDRIDGIDEDFKHFEHGFFPAAVADPDKFGGEKVNALVGVKLIAPQRNLANHSIEIEGGVPIYQSLNGPQPKEAWRINASWHWKF